MFIVHCQAQKIGRKWCAKPEITNCAPATSKLYMQPDLVYKWNPIIPLSKVQVN
jgi:hypothetical protein